jgi:Tfp pilus assembly protein PilF/spermidine synthase
MNHVAGEWLELWRLSWPTHVFVHVSLVFLLPVCLLGTILPVVIRTAIEQAAGLRSRESEPSPNSTVPAPAAGGAGRVIGGIYAWSAAGGLLGTLWTGFFLIPATGGAALLWLVAAALLMVAVLYWASCVALYLWAMVFAALATMGMSPAKWAQGAGETAMLRERPDPNVVYEGRTPYSYVAVRRTSERPDRREFVQDKLCRAETIMEDATNLRYFYARVCTGLTNGLVGNKDRPAMLVIGSGGYAFPRCLKTLWPGSFVEVVEPDSGVTRAATAAFGLDRTTSIKTIAMDARSHLDRLLKAERAGAGARRYDFIYEDSFNDYAVPFPLVTKEFNDQVYHLLADNGVYMVNLIDAIESSRLLGAVVATLDQTFPNVYVVTGRGGLPSLRDSLVVVAAKHKLDVRAVLRKHDEYLKFQVLDASQMDRLRDTRGGIILTDDYAPVENLLAPVVRQGAPAVLAQKHLEKARTLQREGRSDLHHAWELPHGDPCDASAVLRSRGLDECQRCIEQYTKAIELDPSLTIEACNEIGLTWMDMDRPEEAERTFRNAIDYHQTSDAQDPAIASVYRNLAMLLRRAGKKAEGNAPLAEAAKWLRIEAQENPRSAVVWEQLGGVLAMRDDMKGASDAFEKALDLEPGDVSHYEKLAKTLEHQKRYGEAIEVVRRQMKLLEDRKQREEVVQARQHLELLEYERAKLPH